jgi:peptide/nickel transport system permease protein
LERTGALLIASGKRVLVFLVTLAGATLLAQLLLWLAPGDAVDLVTDDPELRAAMVAQWGLDQPVLIRYARFMAAAVGGDLGTSLTYRPGAPVVELLGGTAGRSLSLVLGALVTSLAWGVGLAYLTAGRSSALRRAAQIVSVAPVFLLAWLAMSSLNEVTFSLMEAGRIARPGWFALPDEDSALKTALAVIVLAVGSSALTEIHAAAEDELTRIRRSGYVDAARARGAPLWPHVLLNLLPPVSSLAASRAAFFVGGLVIIEKVLHLNGVGAMLWQACRMRDYPLALGITVVAAAAVCGARLLADLVRVTVDPRLREGA